MQTELLEQVNESRLTRRPATLEEFWALPESLLPVEYINGEIVMAPSPTRIHQKIVRDVFRTLDAFVQGAGLGELFFSPLDVILPTGEVVQPDIFFLTSHELKRAGSGERLSVVPSLVIEVLSPGSAKHDTVTKREIYERNGVREYWIVDPETRGIAQLVLRKKHYVVTEFDESDVIRGVVLRGFEMKVGALLGVQ